MKIIALLMLCFLVQNPIIMLLLGGLHTYWPLIPALGYGALAFISFIVMAYSFFYTFAKEITG